MDNYVDLPINGGPGEVTSLNGLSGALTLVAGNGISIATGVSTITISAVGAAVTPTTTITTSYGALPTDSVILCNNAAPITITLPTPTNGYSVTIKDIRGTASTNNITIARNSTEMIEGLAASYIYQTNFGAIKLIADGTNWWVI